MTTYSETQLRDALREALEDADLTWEKFLELGERDELGDISADLVFAYKNIVPHLDRPVPA